jgi:hypothetical protein
LRGRMTRNPQFREKADPSAIKPARDDISSLLSPSGESWLESRQEVSQLRRLSEQVISRGPPETDSAWLAGYALYYLYAMRFELADFVRIIRKQTNAVDPEGPQGSGGEAVVPRICGESQMLIGFDGVHTAVLKLVGPQFIHQPNSTALLRQIKKKACPRRRNFSKRQLQLGAAIATLRTEHVAGKALRVNADQRNRAAIQTPARERDGRLFRPFSLDSQDSETAVLRRQFGIRNHADLCRAVPCADTVCALWIHGSVLV